MAVRPTRKGPVDAVVIIPIVKRAGQSDAVILVSQFRPPTNGVCLEFPAGLVDEGESAAQAALRELSEETGYVGQIEDVSPILFSDPGTQLACVGGSIHHVGTRTRTYKRELVFRNDPNQRGPGMQ
jgi:8-oxo-dGTP pyrophosphatase MutT (NUDIX family)